MEVTNTFEQLVAELEFRSTEFDERETLTVNVGLLRKLVMAANLMDVGTLLVNEAMEIHIYNEQDGDVPKDDCQYLLCQNLLFVKAGQLLSKQIEGVAP